MPTRNYKNIIQGASGAFGNAATRFEEFVVKGGNYAYGSYPEIDELFPLQAVELDRTKRAAILAKMQHLLDERTMYVSIWQLAFISGVGPRVTNGLRIDQGLRLYRALRRDHAEERIEACIHAALHRSTTWLLAALAAGAVADHLLLRPRHRRSGGAAGRAWRQRRRYRGDPSPVRARSAALVQYGLFMANLLRGDFGQSFYYQTPVLELYLDRLPNSLLLAAVAMAFSLLVGIPTGILAAVRVGRFWDSAGKLFTLLGLSLPSFFVGLVMILVFSVYLGWLPSSGSGTALHLIMPAFALGWYFAAAHMRLTRSSMLEVLGSEYIKLARLKGLPQALVIGKHAFKNALIPVLTLAGINLVLMINVAVVVETVFAWPGIGRLLYEGISFRDFPVVQGVVIMGGTMIVVVNLLVDIVYAVIDPRIRLET